MQGQQGQVQAFHRACGLLAPSQPVIDWAYLKGVGMTLIEEETEELLEAICDEDQSAFIAEAVDVLYVVYGALVASGVDVQPYFDAIQHANMMKARGPKRFDGKQLKPKGWEPANIDAVTIRNSPPGQVFWKEINRGNEDAGE